MKALNDAHPSEVGAYRSMVVNPYTGYFNDSLPDSDQRDAHTELTVTGFNTGRAWDAASLRIDYQKLWSLSSLVTYTVEVERVTDDGDMHICVLKINGVRCQDRQMTLVRNQNGDVSAVPGWLTP